MKLLAVCFGVNQADKEHIVKVISVANILRWDLEITDVRISPIDLKDVIFVFTFGEKAAMQTEEAIRKNSTNLVCLHLPTIKQLYPVEQGGDELARTKALADLVELQAAFGQDRVELFEDKKTADSIKVTDLPDYSIAKIQAIEKAVKESGKNIWLLMLKNKKILALTIDGKIGSQKVDINMTFSELIALRAAMDILEVQEVKFVLK